MAYEISLHEKTALITGGARGIGAQICRQMAQAGANICINYYHSDIDRKASAALSKELELKGTKVLQCEADISKEAEVNEMFDKAESLFGTVDIIVNNAGILISRKFDMLDKKSWDNMLDVILNGAFYVCKRGIPGMLRKEAGSIIMITTNCTINGGGGSAAYPAAKSGVEGLAKQLVLEYASKGIRTNIIQPAVIDTEMFRQRYKSDEEVLEYGKTIPVGRVGKPVDIANAAVFLSSDKASYICGAALQVDGGRTFYK